MNQLWCIHIPGPDECHPAPCEAAAHHMAAKHNAAMAQYFELNPDQEGIGPLRESCWAKVIEWPWSAADHAESMDEFDYVAWGLDGGAA